MPTYQVQQNVYVDLPIEQLKQNFDEIMALGIVFIAANDTDWISFNGCVAERWGDVQ